jgi:hypothetical protein
VSEDGTARSYRAPAPSSLRALGGIDRPRYCPASMRARIVLVLLLLSVSSCLWRSYGEVMRVHLDVLSSLADKAAANVQDGRRPASNDVTELSYPLQRGRQFVYQYRSYDDRASYRLFVAALDRYQAFVEAIDGARGDEARWTAERADLDAKYQSWRNAAADARAALARES